MHHGAEDERHDARSENHMRNRGGTRSAQSQGQRHHEGSDGRGDE
ncbi:MAG: hypothetical protein M5R42_11470 [Rhodocyclaceae bacterium]|nr:hypothetical protein [Rhodocyclaceae bacterium]